MNRFIPVSLALLAGMAPNASFAQNVSDAVNRQLWCGTAYTVAFGGASRSTTDEQTTAAKIKLATGTVLIAEATRAHLAAGFTQEAIDRIKAELVRTVTSQIGGDDFSLDECDARLAAQPRGPSRRRP